MIPPSDVVSEYDGIPKKVKTLHFYYTPSPNFFVNIGVVQTCSVKAFRLMCYACTFALFRRLVKHKVAAMEVCIRYKASTRLIK